MRDVDAAYLAGLMDGEGSWSIQVDFRTSSAGIESVRFNPAMTMTLRYGKNVLERFTENFGGKIYHYSNDMDRWNLGRREKQIEATEKLLPYLQIKREIALRFLGILESFPARAAHGSGERTLSDPTLVIALAESALTLNPERSRKRFASFDDIILRIKKIYNVE